MKRFTDAGRAAIKAGNLYAGLSLALTLPDICASLEDPGPGKSRSRYIRWAKEWVEPRFTHSVGMNANPTIFISAGDLYQLRCSLVHSGSANFEPHKDSILERFVFFDESTGAHMNLFSGISINGVQVPPFLQLKVPEFSFDIFDAADEWDSVKLTDKAVQAEKTKLLVIRSRGFSIGNGTIRF